MLHFHPKSSICSKLSAARRFLPLIMLTFLLALSSCVYTEYSQHKSKVLDCIRNGEFKVYSMNLGSSPIDKTIKQHQDKELRLHLYEAVSSAAIGVRTIEKTDSSDKNEALRICLGSLGRNGKNVTLIFPDMPSEKDYIIEADFDTVARIKQLLGIR